MRISDSILNEILCSQKPWEAAEAMLSGELLKIARECKEQTPPYDMWAGLHVIGQWAEYSDPDTEYKKRVKDAQCAMANMFRALLLQKLGK